MVVVVCTSLSENSTKRSQLFTQFAVVSRGVSQEPYFAQNHMENERSHIGVQTQLDALNSKQ